MLALSVAIMPQATDTAAASVDGCATLYGTRVALDTVRIEVRPESGCASLVLELATPTLQPLPRLRTGDGGDYVSVALRAVNRTRETLRAPLYLYANDDLEGTVRGRPIPGWRMRAFVTLYTTYRNLWDPTRGDLPSKTLGNNQRLSLLPSASSPTSEVDSVSPGGASDTVTLTVWVAPDFESWSQSLTVRALRAASLIPPRPPHTFPDSLLAPRRLIEADSVPGPFARDLIRVRFGPKVPYAVRQRFVDRTHGRVVGGVSNSAGEGDYVLQVPDSPDGRGVFEAWRRLGEGVSRIVARRGVMLALAAASPFPPLAQGPVSPDPWAMAGVHVDFVDDADSLERAATLARVGARVRASDGDLESPLVVVGRDSTPAGIAALARRLTYLSTVASVFAWARARDERATFRLGSGTPPVDSGRAGQDPDVRRFVEALALPSVHAIRDILFLPSHGLLFFSVTYGQPMDVYPSVVGVRHGRRIGLLWSSPEIAGPRFTLRRDDMVLAAPAVLDTLEDLEAAPTGGGRVGLYGSVVLPWLVEDSLVPPHVLRRCVRRIYRNAGGCSGARVALAATRIKDLATLTQLSFLSGKWGGDGEAIQPAREALRRLAPAILADARQPRATLFALAQAVAAGPPDSALIARLVAHSAVQRDASLLALLAEGRPWVLRKLIALLPGGPGAHAAIESLFLPRRGADREAVVAVLADPVLGRDRAILAAIANAPPVAFPAASAEAGRRLPDGEFRRGAYSSEPPPLP